MAIIWPASLPQNPNVGVIGGREDANLRTKVDAGPQQVRTKFRGALETWNVPFVWNADQVEAWDAFWTSIQEGVLPFDHVHPVTRATVSIKMKRPPQFLSVLSGSTKAAESWTGTVQWEIQP
jgi:hypothetical protein